MTGRIPGLNALRFLGALSVIALHLGSFDVARQGGWDYWHPLVSGKTGVILFYVLSGFLITSLAIDETRKSGRFAFGLFLGRRALRLFPLYYLAIFVIFLLALSGKADVPSGSWPYALFYAYNYVPREAYNGLLGSFHTLATEEQFYLFYGLALWLAFGRTLPAGAARRKWVFVFIGAVLLIVANDSLVQPAAAFAGSHFPHRWLVLAMDPLLVGCCAAIILRNEQVERMLEHFRGNEASCRTLGTALVLTFAALYVSFAALGNTTLLSIGFVALVVHFYLFREAPVHRVLEVRPLVYLGTISYGLYVWQAVVLGTGAPSRWIDPPLLAVVYVFLLSVVSYEFFEKRFLGQKRYPSGGKAPEPTAAREKVFPTAGGAA